jgi:Zn finger protein HypA/HybF involved in hydrogenase expression
VHELSLAVEISRIADAHASPQSDRVAVVGVEVGDDAGVEPENLAFCLDVLLRQPPFGHARCHVTRTGGSDLRVTYLEVDDDGPDD